MGFPRPEVHERPRTGDQAGWPRPRATMRDTFGSQVYGLGPVPWVARQDPAMGFLGGAFDARRSQQMTAHDLCQVCGRERGSTVYMLLGAGEYPRVTHAGGALCSVECAKLTAGTCPHYRSMGPVEVYALPRLGPRRSRVSIREIDDAATLVAPRARLVATVHTTPAARPTQDPLAHYPDPEVEDGDQ